MIEKIVYMQVENQMVTFEKEDGNTIIYPLSKVPKTFKSGDVIKVIIFADDLIGFMGLDEQEMAKRRKRLEAKKSRLKERIRVNHINL